MPRDLFETSGPRDLLEGTAQPVPVTPPVSRTVAGVGVPSMGEASSFVAKQWQPGGSFGGFGRGVTDVMDSITQMVTRITSKLPGEMGRVGEASTRQADTAISEGLNRYQSGRSAAGETGIDWGRILGNVAGTAPAAFAMPGATGGILARTGSGMMTGGLTGGLQPVDTTKGDFATEKAKQVGIGAAAGGVMGGLTGGLSRMLAPKTSPDVQMLRQAGVTPTPGQAAGGIARSVEEKARSIPFAGEAVGIGERRALHEFNRATINRALAPIGQTVSKDIPVGRDAVSKAGELISRAYDDVLPKMTGTADAKFATDMASVAQRAASELPGDKAGQFGKMIQNVFRKAGQGQTITGEKAKEIVSQLNGKAAEYGKSMDPDQRALGSVFRDAADAFKAMMARGSPDHAARLADVDTAYAAFLRVETAAGRLGSKEGIFTPAALNSAARAMDRSMRKRAFSRGNALMQDWATAGEKVLGNRVPDSGTAGRAMLGLGALTGGAGVVNPYLGAGVGAGSLMYTPLGQKIMAAIIAGQRPYPMQQTGDLLGLLGPAISAGSGGAAVGMLPQR